MEPHLFVIFGATGDLTKRKLIPALYLLDKKGQLPEGTSIVGVARRDIDFGSEARSSIEKPEKEAWARFSNRLHYLKNDFEDEADYPQLKSFLDELSHKHNITRRLYYLAVMPSHFHDIAFNMKKCGFLGHGDKLIVEKPFGSSLDSARKLNKELSAMFGEKNIYRIDHYLGKESVQNLYTLRFANALFEGVWNSRFIEHVQITAAENIGVNGRGGYYDNYGALKDMVQNHMLQLLSLTAMEPPEKFEDKHLLPKKLRVLDKTRVRQAIFGQYEGFTEEKGVKQESETETYVALRAEVNTPRWKGTPFFIRTGKNLKSKSTEIVLQFRNCIMCDGIEPNRMVIKLQPEEGIHLNFNIKRPGNTNHVEPVAMDFCHRCLFGFNTPEAYERLLQAAFEGEKMHFTSWEEVEASWKVIDSIRRAKPEIYRKGSSGPDSASALVNWRSL